MISLPRGADAVLWEDLNFGLAAHGNAASCAAYPCAVVAPSRRTTGIAACCARATSGQAAAPPSSVMNSRRFIGLPPKAKDHERSIAALGAGQWRASHTPRA